MLRLKTTFAFFVSCFCVIDSYGQSLESSVDELVKQIRVGGEASATGCTDILKMKQENGEDISQAAPILRTFVKQRVDRHSQFGVRGNAANALLSLMRLGDTDAIEHYLLAQRMYSERTKEEVIGKHPEYLDAIDPAHFAQATALLWHQYSFSINERRRATILKYLTRFSSDKRKVVAALNSEIEPNHSNLYFYMQVINQLADQAGLLPDFEKRIRQAEQKTPDEFELRTLALLAPFRKEALELFVDLSHQTGITNALRHSFYSYADSANRLPEKEKTEAFQRLQKQMQSAYDQIKPVKTKYIPEFTPQFHASLEETYHSILRLFGEEKLFDPDQYKESLKLDTGLGASF